jgi:hypothetical protein
VDAAATAYVALTAAGTDALLMAAGHALRKELSRRIRDDLLRIEAITRKGLLVRRALDADRATGQRRWTDRQHAYVALARGTDTNMAYVFTTSCPTCWNETASSCRPPRPRSRPSQTPITWRS